jgi:hypothetical protein
MERPAGVLGDDGIVGARQPLIAGELPARLLGLWIGLSRHCARTFAAQLPLINLAPKGKDYLPAPGVEPVDRQTQ